MWNNLENLENFFFALKLLRLSFIVGVLKYLRFYERIYQFWTTYSEPFIAFIYENLLIFTIAWAYNFHIFLIVLYVYIVKCLLKISNNVINIRFFYSNISARGDKPPSKWDKFKSFFKKIKKSRVRPSNDDTI